MKQEDDDRVHWVSHDLFIVSRAALFSKRD